MLKATITADGRKPILLLGLTADNFRLLKQDRPILFDMAEVDLPAAKVGIAYLHADGRAGFPQRFSGTGICLDDATIQTLLAGNGKGDRTEGIGADDRAAGRGVGTAPRATGAERGLAPAWSAEHTRRVPTVRDSSESELRQMASTHEHPKRYVHRLRRRELISVDGPTGPILQIRGRGDVEIEHQAGVTVTLTRDQADQTRTAGERRC